MEELSTTYNSGSNLHFTPVRNVMIRLWNGHLGHFLSRKIYSFYSSLFGFIETDINDSLQNIFMEFWMIGKTSIRTHNMAWHDLAA